MLYDVLTLFKKTNIDDFFEKWYEDKYTMDNFEDHIGFNEDGARDTFEESLSKYPELGRFNLDLKDKHPKVYNREFEKYKEKELKELAEKWFNERLFDFENDFSSKTKLTKNGIECYRAIHVSDKEEFLFKIMNGIYLDDYSGLGVCWAWDESKAEAHWGDGSTEIILKAIIPLSSIDQENTMLLNLDPSIGFEEAEIRLKEDAEIILIGFDHEYLEKPIYLKA